MESPQLCNIPLWVKTIRIDSDESPLVMQLGDTTFGDTIESIYPKMLKPEENPSLFDITGLHLGEVLNPNKTLFDYKFDNNSLLVFLIKPLSSPNTLADSSNNTTSLPQLLSNIRRLKRNNLLYQLTGLLSRQHWLQKTDYFLKNDFFAYSIVCDPQMMNTLLKDVTMLRTVLLSHPSLINVLHTAIAVVSAAQTSRSTQKVAPPNAGAHSGNQPESLTFFVPHDYSVDQDDNNGDDEEEEMDEGDDAPLRLSGYRGFANLTTPVAQIDQALLHSAIAQATRLTPNSQPVTSATSTTTEEHRVTSTSAGCIAPGVLSQAIASAAPSQPSPVASAVEPPSATAVPSGHRWVNELRQLSEMGIVDETAAMQALDAVNGNISLAIQLLFG